MIAEIRADGLHISGYVNVPGRESRPVVTRKHGKVIEIIEQRAFERALARAQSVDLLLDHEKKIASTSDGTLEAKEDAVGLRAEAVITDEEVVQGARQGKLKGWSFNMMNVKDQIEERANSLPIRRVIDFDMSEITLAMRKIPVYSSTSIELRAENQEEQEIEIRTVDQEITVNDKVETPPSQEKKQFDNSEYRNRIQKLKSAK